MTNSPRYPSERVEDLFGQRVAARLSQSAASVPYEVSERLRAARVRALAQRKLAVPQTASVVVGQGGAAALTLGDEGLSPWSRFASALPILALLIGLMVINVVQNESSARELAEVDAALLTDDLPPSAYADPGFVQFLKVSEDL